MSKVSKGVIWQLRKLPKYMMDGENPKYKKIAIIFAVVYIISPIDAVPELFAPVVGWLDDLGVFTLLALFLKTELNNYQKKNNFSLIFSLQLLQYYIHLLQIFLLLDAYLLQLSIDF